MLQGPTLSQEQAHVSRALDVILWTLMAAVPLLLFGIFLIPSFAWRWVAITFSFYGLCIPTFFLNRRGHTRLAAILLIAGLWILLTVFAMTAGGIASYAAIFYLVVIFVAALLLGPRGAIITALLCILTGLGLVIIEMGGQMPSRVPPYTPLSRWLTLTMLTIVVMVLEYFSARTVKEALSQARRELDERERADIALRASEEKYRSLIEQAPDAIFIADSNLRFIDTNTSACELIGYTRAEILNRSIPDLTPAEDAPMLMRRIERLRGGATIIAERKIKRSDGTLVPVEMSTRMLSDGRLQSITRDITERKQTEERLALLQMITMDVAEATDLPSALEVVLRRVCEKTGWALGQAWVPNAVTSALDCCPARFTSDSGLEDFWAATQSLSLPSGIGLPGRVWATGQPVWIRDVTLDSNFPRGAFARKAGLKAALGIPIQSGDKLVAVLEFFLREPRNEDERLVGVISTVAAQIGLVVERKQAEEALRDSQARYRDLINSVDGIVWEADATTFEFSFVSEQAERLLGYPTDQWIKEPTFWKDHIYPDDQIWAVQYWVKATRERRPHELEYRMIAADGRIVWLRNIVAIVLEEGEVVTLRGIMVDITERKLAEEALKSSSEQLRALWARIHSAREEEGTRIAREIHDELGSALTGLKWDLEKIDTTLSGNGTHFPEVQAQIATMTGLIESTIDTVRRISSELRPGVLDDLGLLAAIEWQAHQFQSRTGINFHGNTRLRSVKLSRESATAVFRIFQEILTNVLRHSQATDIYVDLRKRGEHLELEVRDNGRGISNSERENKRSLGLLGMRERALLVDGEVIIAGKNGKGTTVVVRVPVEPGLDGVGHV